MKCCKKLEDFIKNSEDGTGWGSVIDLKSNGKYYIVKQIRSAGDGDGRIDTWVDEQEEIIYCPFCGKIL